jgi:hypothetical protein
MLQVRFISAGVCSIPKKTFHSTNDNEFYNNDLSAASCEMMVVFLCPPSCYCFELCAQNAGEWAIN